MKKLLLTVFTAVLGFTATLSAPAQTVPTLNTPVIALKRYVTNSFVGDLNATYIVQWQPALGSSWTDLGPATLVGGTFYHTHIVDASLPNGFYRLKCVEGIFVGLDPISPLAGLIQISTTSQTQNVPLGVFDIRPYVTEGSIESISFIVDTTRVPVTSLFSQFSLKIGASMFGAQQIDQVSSTEAVVTFKDFGQVALPLGTYVPMTFFVNVQQDTGNALDGATATVTLNTQGTYKGATNNPVVLDPGYNEMPVNSATIAGSTLTFSGSQLFISNESASLGSSIIQGNSVVGYNVSLTFTATAGNQTAYLSSNPTTLLNFTVPAGVTLTVPPSGVNPNPGQVSGDLNVTSANGYYVIPAGTSRQFTINGSVSFAASGGPSFRVVRVTELHFGDTTGALTGHLINYDLEGLTTPAF